MKKFLFLLVSVFYVCVLILPAEEYMNVSAVVSPIFSIQSQENDEFLILNSSGDLIPAKELGSVVVKSNYPTWKLLVDSNYKTSPTIGRLKLEDGEIYIPYTFAIRDGESLVLDQFNIKSSPQAKTPFEGKGFSLTLYFTDDDTVWQQGTYSDTLVFTVTTD